MLRERVHRLLEVEDDLAITALSNSDELIRSIAGRLRIQTTVHIDNQDVTSHACVYLHSVDPYKILAAESCISPIS